MKRVRRNETIVVGVVAVTMLGFLLLIAASLLYFISLAVVTLLLGCLIWSN